LENSLKMLYLTNIFLSFTFIEAQLVARVGKNEGKITMEKKIKIKSKIMAILNDCQFLNDFYTSLWFFKKEQYRAK